MQVKSALPCVEAGILLVDDVDTALAAHQAVLAVACLQRFERILDFHCSGPLASARVAGQSCELTNNQKRAFRRAQFVAHAFNRNAEFCQPPGSPITIASAA